MESYRTRIANVGSSTNGSLGGNTNGSLGDEHLYGTRSFSLKILEVKKSSKSKGADFKT